ncbi:MFS transporter [Sphingorhabdus sp.]|uniref:MFS transporter n=1 Tax=Sphingorhabdus sp. TaxID=1902408 RepID=UPI0032B84A50
MLDTKPMTRAQIVVVAIMVALNALDGFDVLSISFASPGIAQEWGIDRAALGWVLTMELIGMAAGSVLLGRAGDRVGRKPTALASLVLMALGMFMVSTAGSIAELSARRVLTGVGIGGMLAVGQAYDAGYRLVVTGD